MKLQFMWYIRSRDFVKAKQDGGSRSLACVSNNAQAHVYINSSVDFKHKGLESLFLYILVENL